MSNDMLNKLFPDSLWKYGTLTEPEEEETYMVEVKPKIRRKRKTRRKYVKRIPRKQPRTFKPKTIKRPRGRKRIDMVKLRQRRLDKLISELPTAAEYQLRRMKAATERKNRLKVAEKMLRMAKARKAEALVKARRVRLKRLLFELPGSAARHRRVRKTDVSRAKKRELAEKKKLQSLIEMWEKRASKLRAEEVASRKVIKAVSMIAAKPAPPRRYYS